MKAQISFVEYIISFSIFGVFVAYMFFRVLGTMPVYADEIRGERLKNEAFQLSEFLINDPGDPVDWDTVSGGSQTSCPSGWWNSNWQYRKKLTFDNSVQSQGLNNFTTLVKLSLSNFDYSKAKSDGTDLRFIDSDNTTELKYHIEKWNTAGESFVWVKVPNIPASSNTDYMWMYYGNPSATNSQDESGTYDSNHVGVWHLHSFNSTNGTLDSTQYSNDGRAYNFNTNPASTVAGKIGNATKFDGVNDYVNCGKNSALNVQNITAMAWFNSSEKGWNVILFKENYGVNGYWFGTDASGYIYSYIESAGSGRNTESTTVITDGIMHFVVMTYNGSEWNFYIDGKLNYTKDYASYAPISASTN